MRLVAENRMFFVCADESRSLLGKYYFTAKIRAPLIPNATGFDYVFSRRTAKQHTKPHKPFSNPQRSSHHEK